MMTDDQILEVVQAHKEGKAIQGRWHGESQWWPLSKSGAWARFHQCDYRVAPEVIWCGLKGYCFPKDIHETATIGMIKVEQVALSEGENPIARKPREWWITPMKYGLCHVSDEQTNDALWHAREIIE